MKKLLWIEDLVEVTEKEAYEYRKVRKEPIIEQLYRRDPFCHAILFIKNWVVEERCQLSEYNVKTFGELYDLIFKGEYGAIFRSFAITEDERTLLINYALDLLFSLGLVRETIKFQKDKDILTDGYYVHNKFARDLRVLSNEGLIIHDTYSLFDQKERELVKKTFSRYEYPIKLHLPTDVKGIWFEYKNLRITEFMKRLKEMKYNGVIKYHYPINYFDKKVIMVIPDLNSSLLRNIKNSMLANCIDEERTKIELVIQYTTGESMGECYIKNILAIAIPKFKWKLPFILPELREEFKNELTDRLLLVADYIALKKSVFSADIVLREEQNAF
ncbi:MAG: hypothetical protein ACTSU2_02425 [Promethearchaeota archaeon]